MKLNFPWTYKYIYLGGYDCMSSSYEILDSKGMCVLVVDFANFGTYDKDEMSPRAEAIAKFICEATHAQT